MSDRIETTVVTAGDRAFAWGPLLLVAVSRTPQSAAQLRGELLAVHAQIVSTLTRASVARIFARKQNYDLRRLLAATAGDDSRYRIRTPEDVDEHERSLRALIAEKMPEYERDVR